MQFELHYFIRIRATRLEYFAKHDLLSVSYTPPLKFAKHGFKRDLIKHVGAHMQTRSWHHTKTHPPARADYALIEWIGSLLFPLKNSLFFFGLKGILDLGYNAR